MDLKEGTGNAANSIEISGSSDVGSFVLEVQIRGDLLLAGYEHL